MTRYQLIKELKNLGFNALMEDNRTLCAYYWIKEYLHSNYTPISAINKIYFDENKKLRAILYLTEDLEFPNSLFWQEDN